ncbi:unnamed protein product [Thlaspi arvense]|uniref:Uncharacterized protein n=1 Tax=Thlaspi arvense TaxID=13288 RepID=A0AAU9SF94_THLAR|nr:unnamed protein product [Thlaspi arvense]
MVEQEEIVDSASAPVNPEPEEDMELESEREENGEENGSIHKKQKVEERSVEEERLEKKTEVNGSGRVKLGPKEFVSSVEMFDYFNKLLHFWPNNLDLNKTIQVGSGTQNIFMYERRVLLDLVKKGHPEPEKKIGGGIKAFQIRNHPVWKSRCFFLVRVDETADDFSFRKCVDHILPLPENVKSPKSSGGGRGGYGGRRGRRVRR